MEFLFKLIDSMLGTLKSILLIKDKGVLSSIIGGLGTFSYMLILVDVRKAAIVALATTIGGIVSFLIFKKIEKDKTWLFDIRPSSHEEGKEFADQIREQNIPIMTYIGFNEKREKTLCSKIYSCSKEHSRLVESLIPKGISYDILELKHYTQS